MKKYKILPLLAFMLLFSANNSYSSDGYVGMLISEGQDGYPKIHKVLPNSSAQKSGLYQQDRILKINGIDTRNYSVEDVSSMLRGDSGTTVNVLVDNLGEEKEISLLRLARVDCGIEIKKDLNNSVEITKIYKNSGAALSELMIGDKIISIDEQSVINLDEKNIKNLLYGFENAQKQITFTRNGQEKVATIALKDYQITQEEAQQILSDFEKEGYNIAYAIQNGKYDVINAYILAGNTINIDMFEYALAYNQDGIANLMAKQNIDMVREGKKANKKAILKNAVDLLGVAAIATANFVPAAGLASAPLLGAGSNMNITTPKRPNMVEELQSIKENSKNKENIFLFKAVDSNNANILNVYIKANYDLDLALNYAIGNDNEYIAKILVKNGVNPNIPLNDAGSIHVPNISIGLGVENHTAFTYAIARNKIDLVKTMLENGANVNTPLKCKFNDIKKPIDIAAKLKNYEMVDLLRSYGAEL